MSKYSLHTFKMEHYGEKQLAYVLDLIFVCVSHIFINNVIRILGSNLRFSFDPNFNSILPKLDLKYTYTLYLTWPFSVSVSLPLCVSVSE